jgi:hypothetical protein
MLCQPLKNRLCDKCGVGILSVICVILAQTRRPLYQEQTLQTKFDVKMTSWFGGNIAPGFLIEFSTRSFFL